MFKKFIGKNFFDYLYEDKSFIIIFHGKEISDRMGIRPSDEREDFSEYANELHIFEENFPEIVIYEAVVTDEIDSIINMGISTDYFWDEKFEYFRPFFVLIKNGWVSETSLDSCWCLDTLIHYASQLRPDLFEPPSVSES
jgi:hypothetical protein